MKYLILFLLSANAFGADYDGATKVPETKTAAATTYEIYRSGKLQAGSYARHDLAYIALTALSQRCSCEVELVTREKITTSWRVISSSKASSLSRSSSSAKSSSASSKSSGRSSSVSSSSQVATISFKRPTQWSNGDPLNSDQIKGYEVIKTPPGALSVILIPPAADPIEWRLPWQIADTDKVEVRTVLHSGATSVYANVPFVKNN